MSIEVMTTVWNRSQHQQTNLICLLALADAANEDGFCWPGIQTIAHRCRCNKRNALYVIDKLEASGELLTRRGRGYGNTNHYLITVAVPPGMLADLLIRYFECSAVDAVEIATVHCQKRDEWQSKIPSVSHRIRQRKRCNAAHKRATHCTFN